MFGLVPLQHIKKSLKVRVHEKKRLAAKPPVANVIKRMVLLRSVDVWHWGLGLGCAERKRVVLKGFQGRPWGEGF